jgi:hypothetical protein
MEKINCRNGGKVLALYVRGGNLAPAALPQERDVEYKMLGGPQD